MRSVAGTPAFETARELVRKVQADWVIEIDSNAYSVRLIGETVRVAITGGVVRVSHAGREVAVHPRRTGRFERIVDPQHYAGVVGFGPKPRAAIRRIADAEGSPELLRPLLEYERLVGRRW